MRAQPFAPRTARRILLTHDLVLEGLVLTNSLAITLALVLFAVEVLHRLVVEQAVGVNTTNRNVAVVHLPAELGTPLGEHNTGRHCMTFHELRLVTSRGARLTVGRHHEEDHHREGPFEIEDEEDQSNANVRERGQDVENQGL